MNKFIVKYYEQPLAITDSKGKANEVIEEYKAKTPDVEETDFTVVSIRYIPDEE